MALGKYWSVHSHSKYSTKDALDSVEAMVGRAVELGQAALGLTDHGVMGGVARLYRECRKADVEPLPGVEGYVVFDRQDVRAKRWHLGFVAVTGRGYRNLVGLNNLAYRNFYHKPLLDFADLAGLAGDGLLDGIAVTTGCHFGVLHRLMSEHSPHGAVNVLKALAGWFPSGVYVEVQDHGRVEYDERVVNQTVLQVASSIGLPVVITQDSHYVHPHDQALHDFMKRIVSWGADPDDAVFPGDAYCMVSDEDMRRVHSPEVYAAGVQGLDDLLRKAQVRIPEWDERKVFIPDMPGVEDPDVQLRDLVLGALVERIDHGVVRRSRRVEYLARVEEELGILADAGFSPYVLFARMVCLEAASRGIETSARGSACGSLVCWLAGVTPIDPVRWGVDFGRFLTRDRGNPPDIDLELEDARRGEIVDWLTGSFDAAQIGTWSKWSSRGDDEAGDAARGSIVRDYRSMMRRTGVEVPSSGIVGGDMRLIQALSEREPYQSYGVHAGGVVVAPNASLMELVPLMYVASSKTTITAFDKKDVESIGLMKVDVLGSVALTAVRDLQQSTGVRREDIPLSDRRTYSLISSGDVSGCFQLEGKATRPGLVRLRPSRIEDVIASMALFRPAPIGSGATQAYIERKHGRQPMPARHPLIASVTDRTYGEVLYQEQMMDILRGLGMQREQLNRMLKAIKASNGAVGDAQLVISGYCDEVAAMCRAAGVPGLDANWLVSQLPNFAGYSFNMAHATAYGLLAYQTAWWKANYPAHFWVAMLNAYSKAKSHDGYVVAARKSGVRLLRAHVNHSGSGYRLDGESIRKGLVGVPGVGVKAAAEIESKAPFSSVMDIVSRCDGGLVTGCAKLKKGASLEQAGGVMLALEQAGALAGLEVDIPEPKARRTRTKEQVGV